MTLPNLTREIAYTQLQEFFSIKPFVLFGTGTSCAVDAKYGMAALESCLKGAIPLLPLSDAQTEEWQCVLNALEEQSDFEAAMNSISDEGLLKHVIDQTAEHVDSVDQCNVFNVLSRSSLWPAIGLFKRLVARLPEGDRVLHVATPNYDLLAEHAFAAADIAYITGFWGGVIRDLNWYQSGRQMTYAECIFTKGKKQTLTKYKNHVRLYKVHGSLNTFLYKGKVVETDSWRMLPNGVERLLITPGTSKHEKLHSYRDVLLREFDRAVDSHSSFLFLGFGFNDTQLVNNAIGDKLKVHDANALIITRSSNDRIEAILQESQNAWVVCKPENIEGTRIYNRKYSSPLILNDKELWQFDKFATEILGG